MGRQLTFTEDNVKKNPFDYPKLKLAKGESARLTLVEAPWSEYVHSIQKPVLDERGNVIMRTAETSKGKEYETPKLSWVSSPICLGDEEVLDKDGLDPENCPICARAAAGEKGFYPKRKFAVHAIRTNIKPRSFEPVEPYSGSLIIWGFSETIFNKIYAFFKEHGQKDLNLGPCTDEQWQKAELAIAAGTAPTKEKIKEIFTDENKCEDPTVFCGSRKSKTRIEDDLAIVDAEWAKSKGQDTDAVHSTVSLSEGIDALLDEDSGDGVPAVKADEPEAATSFEDLPEEAAPEEKPVVKKAAATSVDSIDSILDDL